MSGLFEFRLEVPAKYEKHPEDPAKSVTSYPQWTPSLIAMIQPFIREALKEDSPPSYRMLTGNALEVLRLVRGTGIEITIKNEEIAATALESILQRIDAIAERQQSGGPVLNSRVNVAVPGLGLLLIDQVHVADNCCTEELQRLITQGWRILAICPQPDQRRPDYILGRTTSHEE